MTRYAMAIDIDNCIGCHSCAIACKSNNNLPNDVWWNRIHTVGGSSMDTASGTYPNDLKMYHLPVNCQHCARPECVAVCPTGATVKRDDGIVMQDTEVCIGCGSCIAACPYNVRTLIEEEPQYYVDFQAGDFDAPKHVGGSVEKCVFCAQRIDRGEKPACMEICSGRCRYWGDLDDPESDISIFLKDKEHQLLLPDAKTEPSVYYVSRRHDLNADITEV